MAELPNQEFGFFICGATMRRMAMRDRRGTMPQRGAALLGFVIATALLASIGGYALLLGATSQVRQGRVATKRGQARSLAEAGLVTAMQRLFADPSYCPGGDGVGGPVQVDTNNNGLTTDATDASVTVIVINCGAGNAHTIRARATYF